MKRSPLGVIFLTVFLDLVGFGLVLPLLPRFAHAHQAAEWQIGLLMATYSLMQFVFAPVWGGLSDRIGRRPVLLFSIGGSVASYLLFAFAPSLPMLFLSRAVAGIMAANISTAQAYVADVTAPEDRAKGMGMVGAAFGLGFIFGPALAGVLAHGPNAQLQVGLAAAGFSLLDLLLAGAVLKESLTPEVRERAIRAPGTRLQRMANALRHPALRLAVLLFFLATVAWSQLEPTAARLAQERFAFDAAETGYLFAYLGFVVAFIQGGFTGRLARRLGERPLIIVGTLCLGAGLAAVPFATCTPGLVGTLTLLGVGQALTVPALYSLVSRSAGADTQGSTLGVTQGFSSLARAVGPALGGLLFGIAHPYPFWFGAVLMALAFALGLRIPKPAPAPAGVPLSPVAEAEGTA